ncbi:Zn-dependent oxidoreductase, NADPH:quinone reductase [Frankia sp. BMG5.23]|uniref:Alcohol dehydrogenase, zinc-binding n=1 Tax=Frankia casuarinae (strain DSM 45818 / CECT 9043 / HFP020203 / CcI3) TaxID=106370 RepID=Q2JCR9_FRACC|nr:MULTISPECIES: NADP-dependent oxidoreductase [Frankia]ABD10923.1 Alcohol dehydrogenase, zinc-binding [Frankia casuarinae]KDA42908.1 Zn-dependent oxidoreductase, NADPH:quinone reductase [Frankia sp. BMG5.23]
MTPAADIADIAEVSTRWDSRGGTARETAKGTVVVVPKAYVYNDHGGPEVEAFADLPIPVAGPGQLTIAVRAAGVNPVDWKLRGGLRLPAAPPAVFPVVLGVEASGVVTQVGPDVNGFAVGDEVFGSAPGGGYAEYTVLTARESARKPAAVSFVAAATLPVAAATAYDGVHQLALPPGATLLIIGVGGGVGVAAAQIARHAGLTVVGTASAGKKDFVEALGVAHVEPGPDVADRVRAAASRGVDGIYDLVGGETLDDVVEVLADRSKLVTALSGASDRYGGTTVQRARDSRVLDAVAQLVVDDALDPLVTATFPLDQAPAALRAVENGHARGKIVIKVAA